MMEEREKHAKDAFESMERDWAEVGGRAEKREAALREEAERERKGREIAEKRAEQMEGVLERMGRGELPMPGRGTSGTPLRTPGNPDLMTDGIIGLSPTVAMASKAQRSGKTFTEVYADYVRLQDEYARKSAEYDHMDRTLSAVLAQIEERVRVIYQMVWCHSNHIYRRLFFLNNVLSTSAFNQRPHSWQLNLLKPSLIVTTKRTSLGITLRSFRSLCVKTNYFKNNWQTLADRCNLC
jgi:hypothetical protein